MTLCGPLAAMDSVPTPNATSPMQPGIKQFQTQEIKQDLQVWEDELIQEIDAEDVGPMTPFGQLAAIDSAPTPITNSPMSNATSLM